MASDTTEKPTIQDLKAKLGTFLETLGAIREAKGRIEAVIDDHPLRRYKPFGLPVKLGGLEAALGGKQYAFHCSLAKERLASGGNRAGKTEAGGAEAAMHISGEYPDWYPMETRIFRGETGNRPGKGRIVAPSYEQVDEFDWPAIVKWLPRSLVPSVGDGLILNSGGHVQTASFRNAWELSCMTQKQAVVDHTGAHGHFGWMDEPAKEKAYYTELLRYLIDNNGPMWLTMTRTKSTPWVNQLFIKASRSFDDWGHAGPYSLRPEVFQFDARDNPRLLSKVLDHFERRLDHREVASRIHGQGLEEELIVLKNFSSENAPEGNVLPVQNLSIEDSTWYMSVDPHDARCPAVLYACVLPPDRLGIEKKIIVAEIYDEEQITIADSVECFAELERNLRVRPRQRVMDPRTGPKKIKTARYNSTIREEWTRASKAINHPMYFILGNGDVDMGHATIRKMFSRKCADGTSELQIASSCEQLIEACESALYTEQYKLDEKNSPGLCFLQALRFFVLLNPRYMNLKQQRRELVEDYATYSPDSVTGY